VPWAQEHSGHVLGWLALARGVPHPFPPVMDIPAPSWLHLRKTHPNSTPLVTLWTGYMAGGHELLIVPCASTWRPHATFCVPFPTRPPPPKCICFDHVEQRFHISVNIILQTGLFRFLTLVLQVDISTVEGHTASMWSSGSWVGPENVGSMILRSIVINLQDYTVSLTRRPPTLSNYHSEDHKIILCIIVLAV
jgi:hypothetical protein